MTKFHDDIKEEMVEMKEDIKKLQSESLAYEIVKYQRKQNKRLFIAWLLTFIAFIGLLSYTIYLLNDINTTKTTEEITTTTEYNQDIDDVGDMNNSNIVNGGDING